MIQLIYYSEINLFITYSTTFYIRITITSAWRASFKK